MEPKNVTVLTPEQKANEDIARQKRFGIKPTVSADEIATPPQKISPPLPQVSQPTNTNANIIGTVANNTQSFIEAQSAEAQKAKELAGLIGEQTFDAAGQRQQLTENYGVPTNLARLQDIQTQLAKRNEQTQLQKAQATAGGAGAVQAQRALTLADKQASIRDAGLAAEASVLQGNIETASTLINNAMSDYYQDRTLTNQNMIQQLEYFSGVADKQTAQLLQKEQRKYEEDQAQILRSQNLVDSAVSSGFASPEQIKEVLSMSGDPAAQSNYALKIISYGAAQKYAMERAAAGRAQQNADLARRGSLLTLAAAGDPQAIAELGFDPNAPIKEAELFERNKTFDKQIEGAQKTIDQIDKIVGNSLGVAGATGVGFGSRSGFLAGVFQPPKEEITLPTGEVMDVQSPVGVPTLQGGLRGIEQKRVVLAELNNLLTKDGLSEIATQAEMGVKLTPITEKELSVLFDAASTLNSMVVRDSETNKIVDIPIGAVEFESAMQELRLSALNLKNELAADKNLGNSVYTELNNLQQKVSAQ